jgi:hypothetical protein
MSQPELKTRRQLVTETIRRLVTYTTEITHFGPNSVGLALAEAVAGATSTTYRLYRALLRRQTLLASSDEFLSEVAEEKGALRQGPQQAKLFCVVVPHTATVTEITIGATDLIEVDDSSNFAATDSIRIRSADGTDTEIRTIIAITTASGPNGGDELEVATLTATYAPTTEDVVVLLRTTVPLGTSIKSSAGVSFDTLEAVTTGDSNPVLNGESTFLGLADKVWCECQESGAIGNIDPLTIEDFTVPIPGVARVFNPERGTNGAEAETDFDLKFRASHGPTRAGQETFAWIEQSARDADQDVLRAVRTGVPAIATLGILVLHRNGGILNVSRRDAIEAYMEQRVRSYMGITIGNITLTSVEVSAQVQLDADAVLRDVWILASQRLATFMDFRKRVFGEDVDEADLLSIVSQTDGVAGVVTSTFLPASNVLVDDLSLPVLVRLTLENTDTGDIINAELQVGF